jgi:hypothetical protein
MTDDTALLSTKDLAGVSAYHTERDCKNLPAETREWPVAKAERRGLAECRLCDDDHEVDTQSNSRSLRAKIEDPETDVEVEI